MRAFGVNGGRLPDSASKRPALSLRPPARGLKSTPTRVDPMCAPSGCSITEATGGRRNFNSNPLSRFQERCSSRLRCYRPGTVLDLSYVLAGVTRPRQA